MIKVYTQKKSILDIPNARSSHSTPTPRGGGLAIIVVFYLGLFWLKNEMEPRLFYALLWGIPIALISAIDDFISLSSRVRFIVQSIAVIGALWALGGVWRIDFIWFDIEGWWLNILVFFAMLWITNLYNFMDGIDGYAAAESIVLGLGLYLFGDNPMGMVIIAAASGFLVFNWHKASIFMGDVGSATLGFLFSVFVFYDTEDGNIYIWLVLLSLFWFDATVTLFRRYFNGERITEAHRKHAYQRLVQSGWGHDRVAGAALFINFVFMALLYFVEPKWLVFLVNIVVLTILLGYIEYRKSFR